MNCNGYVICTYVAGPYKPNKPNMRGHGGNLLGTEDVARWHSAPSGGACLKLWANPTGVRILNYYYDTHIHSSILILILTALQKSEGGFVCESPTTMRHGSMKTRLQKRGPGTVNNLHREARIEPRSQTPKKPTIRIIFQSGNLLQNATPWCLQGLRPEEIFH